MAEVQRQEKHKQHGANRYDQAVKFWGGDEPASDGIEYQTEKAAGRIGDHIGNVGSADGEYVLQKLGGEAKEKNDREVAREDGLLIIER